MEVVDFIDQCREAYMGGNGGHYALSEHSLRLSSSCLYDG
jgi:hypothetical protein